MTAPLTVLRASSLPLAFKCPGSVRQAGILINETNEAAETGTAAHKCLERLATRGSIDWDGINAICDELGGDSEEVRMLCSKAGRMWAKFRESFPAALTEIAVERQIEIGETRITGHIDLVSISGDIVRILDWKTGRKDSNYAHQMWAYLALVLLAFPQLSRGTATIAWLRDDEIETYHMTQADAEAWLKEFVDTVVNWDGEYRPGEHCQWCKRYHECAAANALTRAYVAALADVDIEDVDAQIDAMAPGEVIDVYRKAKLVARVAEKAIAAIKARALKAEIVDRTGGTSLTIKTEQRREIVVANAWPVLESLGFNDEDFAACVKLRMSRLEKRVAENAGNGAGEAARRSLRKKLELAGAIELREIQTLIERR